MKKNKVIDLYVRIYPYLLILPMLMLLTSTLIRVNEYGITESRYYAILFVIFGLGSIFLIKKFKVVKYIPLFLAGLLLFSMMPFVSAESISKCSQESRLINVLEKNNMLKNNQIIPKSNISAEDKEIIEETLYYFELNHDLAEVDILPDDFLMSNAEVVFGFNFNSFRTIIID